MAKQRIEELKGRRLGRVLTKMGVVTRDQVQEALALQEDRQSTLGQLLIELGYVEQEQLNGALGYQQGMDTVDLSEFDIPRRCWR